MVEIKLIVIIRNVNFFKMQILKISGLVASEIFQTILKCGHIPQQNSTQ